MKRLTSLSRFAHAIVAWLGCCVAVAAPTQESVSAPAPAPVSAPKPALADLPSLDLRAMDSSVDPCSDFYAYACGGWQKANPIPPDESSWDVYSKLAEDNLRVLRGILEAAAADPAGDALSRRIGTYYLACMDEAAIEARGIEPLRPDLDAIAALKSVADVAPLLARLQRETPEHGMLFDVGSQQDPDDSERQIAAFDQGGLGLPDRDDYSRDDAKSREVRARYVAHVAQVLVLLGEAPAAAAAKAQRILRLETALAAASLTRVERRDPYQITHKMTRAGLVAMAPRLDWPAYLRALGAPAFDTANVTAPGFFAELSRRLAAEPLALWQDYLRFHLANARAPFLSAAFVDEDFAFYRQYLRGAAEPPPRWKRCVRLVDAQLGEALGQAFVKRLFPAQSRAAVLRMTQGIEDAMARRLQELDWMEPATKQAALAKLHAIRLKIGYPEKWRDYSAVRVARDDFEGNVRRAARFEFERQLAKIGQPVDHDEWQMTPPTVNAYFDAQMNDINFPAGVLQPPLYDPAMDDAPNFGDTGGTIGHELTHAFDDEGRQYDAHGNLKDWWAPQDAQRFGVRAQCIVDQYAQYVAIDDIHLNSKLSLGEDIADLGGEILAYAAWRRAAGPDAPARDGLSAEQRFFVGFAQWACENVRPEQARLQALTNPHSPGRFRINGVVVNMPEFARAFSCKAGAPMTKPPGKACSIW
jgi:endothelin-converting enzyme/putative endopeptidase